MSCEIEFFISLIYYMNDNIKVNNLIGQISLVFCEPYFETSVLPWHSLQFLYQLKSCSHLLAKNAAVLPQKMTIWGLPVQFRDLWKIRYPLDNCCGFDMKPFDEVR